MENKSEEHIVISDYFMNKEEKISEWTNEEVILFHSIIHQSYGNKTEDELKGIHDKVVSELKTRGLNHRKYDNLDEED